MSATPQAPAMSIGLNARLSTMMFLQYAIWGAWLPLLFPFLMGHRDFSLDQVSMILAGGAVGAIIGPFIAGQVADRYFNTERFLGLSHIVGGLLVWFLADISQYVAFLMLSIVYGIVYAPTMALTNSLAFHHMPDRDRDFGRVRVWGTIGWIAAGIAVGQWLLYKHTPDSADLDLIAAAQDAGRADAFRLSAVLGVLMGLFCFTLPATPPAKSDGEANATMEALGEIKRNPLLTLFMIAVPVSIIHQFYFVHTSQFLSVVQREKGGEGFASAINKVLGVGGGGLMTIGQMTEILVLAGIPFFAKSLSRKSLLLIGLAAYAGRMALFAYTDSLATILVGIGLHGLCFGCFIFVAFMIVDEETTGDVKASAQNLFNLVIVGIGIIVGSWFAGSVVGSWATVPQLDAAGAPLLDVETGEKLTQMDYTRLFSVPMWIAVACFAILLVLYPARSNREASAA